MGDLKIFGLGTSHEFAKQVAALVGPKPMLFDRFAAAVHNVRSPSPWAQISDVHEERRPDGEIYCRSCDNVRGADVFVITSLFQDEYESVDQKVMKVLLFVNTLRHASAARITLCAPYLGYARQDRKTESRAPIATQAIARMFEAAGLDRVPTRLMADTRRDRRSLVNSRTTSALTRTLSTLLFRLRNIEEINTGSIVLTRRRNRSSYAMTV